MSSHSEAAGVWAVELQTAGEFIGCVGLSVPSFQADFTPCTEILWRLARARWGRGYATEAARACVRFAFSTLSLPEVVSFTAVRNVRSRAVMERLGLRARAELRAPRCRLVMGYCDVLYSGRSDTSRTLSRSRLLHRSVRCPNMRAAAISAASEVSAPK